MKLSEIKITPIIDSLKLEDISDKVYFGEKYANYISNSRLELLVLNPEDPTKFFEGLQVNTKYADSLQFGSLIHELTLQPESFFLVENIDRPTAKAGMMADELYHKSGRAPTYEEMMKASKKIDYYAKSFNSDKANDLRSKCNAYWRSRAIFENSEKCPKDKIPLYIDSKNRIRLKSCLEAIEKDSNIQSLLHPTGILRTPKTSFETTILLDVKVECPDNEPFILRLKSKLDDFTIDFDNNTILVNDLKTTGKPVNYFNDAIDRFHYYREMYMYSFLLSLCAKKFFNLDKPTIKSNFLVVESVPNYYTKVVPMTAGLFLKGKKEFTHLLKLVAFYCCNGYEGFRENYKL